MLAMLEWGRKSAGAVQVLQDGSPVARIRASSWRERADAEIDGQQWRFFKHHGTLNAQRDVATQPHIVASKPSILRQGWEIHADAVTYRIEPAGFLRTGYRVLRAGERIGSSSKAGFWASRPTLDVDATVPLEHQMFLLWVAYIMRRRASGAAAGGGGGGT